MKFAITAIALCVASSQAVAGLDDLTKKLEKKVQVTQSDVKKNTASSNTSNDLIAMASSELGLSPELAQAGIGSLLSVAQDNLGKDSFAQISAAIPQAGDYIKAAPEMDASPLTALFGQTNKQTKAVSGLGYLDSAFKTLGIPKETMVPMANLLGSYLEQNGYGTAANLLKQGLNFL